MRTGATLDATFLPPSIGRVKAALTSVSLRSCVLFGVCLLAFSTPLRQVVRLDGVGTLTKVVGVAVFPLAALEVVRRRDIRPFLEVHALILLFACWAALSYFWSIDPETTFRQSLTIAQLVALVWLIWEFARHRGQLCWVLASFVAGCYVIAGGVILEFLSDPSGPSRYSTAPGVQPNGVAFLMGLGIPIAWYLSNLARPWLLKLTLRSYVLIALPASLLTGSRGGLFTTAAGLCIIPATFGHLGRRGKMLLAVGLVVAGLALALVFPTSPVQRLTTTSSELRGGDFHNRRALWNAAMVAFDENLAGGAGAGASRVRIRQLTEREDGAHNTFISVAADLGLVGLALFCLILLAIARMVLLSKGQHRKLGAVLLATLLLGLLPRHWEYDKPTWLVLAMLIGVAAVSPSLEPATQASVREPPRGPERDP